MDFKCNPSNYDIWKKWGNKMMKKHLSKISLIISCILLCATITVTAVSAVASTNSSGTYNPNNASITNLKTTNAIEEYIESIELKNSKLTKVNLEDVMTTITFSKAMTANDIEAYVETYDIEIVQLQARGYDKYGNRITFFSRTDKGFEETFRMLNELAESDDVEFAGAIGMYALANSASVSAMQNDNRTLLVDTSADQYHNNNNTVQGNERNAKSSNEDESPAFTNSIAWDAEDLGIVYYSVAE